MDADADVALHPEGVDRNHSVRSSTRTKWAVALHPEGVDRNTEGITTTFDALVALHPEGVDRNLS